MLCRCMTSTLAIPLIAGLMPGVLLDAAAGAQLAERPPSLAGVEAYSAPLNEGNDLIGTRPPGCAFCEASAPALNDFWRRYGSRGLVVVGFYHHKASEPLSLANVKKQSR